MASGNPKGQLAEMDNDSLPDAPDSEELEEAMGLQPTALEPEDAPVVRPKFSVITAPLAATPTETFPGLFPKQGATGPEASPIPQAHGRFAYEPSREGYPMASHQMTGGEAFDAEALFRKPPTYKRRYEVTPRWQETPTPPAIHQSPPTSSRVSEAAALKATIDRLTLEMNRLLDLEAREARRATPSLSQATGEDRAVPPALPQAAAESRAAPPARAHGVVFPAIPPPPLFRAPGAAAAAALPPPAAAAGPPPAAQLPAPQAAIPIYKLKVSYDGNAQDLRAFLNKVTNYMTRYWANFPDDGARVDFITGFLEGQAGLWAAQLYATGRPETQDFPAFLRILQQRFADPAEITRSEEALRNIRQRQRPLQEYVWEFRGHVERLEHWGEEMRIQYFRAGLNPKLLKFAISRANPRTLEQWIQLASTVEADLLSIRDIEQSQAPTTRPATPQRGRTGKRISGRPGPREPTREWVDRRDRGLCFTCGKTGHRAADCPTARPAKDKKARKGPKPAASSGTAKAARITGPTQGDSESSESGESAAEELLQGNDTARFP